MFPSLTSFSRPRYYVYIRPHNFNDNLLDSNGDVICSYELVNISSYITTYTEENVEDGYITMYNILLPNNANVTVSFYLIIYFLFVFYSFLKYVFFLVV